MRVLHVIPAIAARYGGPSQAVLGMCRALRRHAGVEAEIATTDADGPAGRVALDGPNPCLVGDVPVWLFPRSWSERWKYSRGLGRWLQSHVGGYDLLHVHAVFSYATTAACRAAARGGVPWVLRPCGMLAPYSLGRSRLSKAFYWRLVERRNARQAAWLHATTPAEKRELEQLLPGQRVECIPLGLDEDAFSTPRRPGAFRDRFGIPPDRPLVLFLSRLHRKKGLVDLLLPAVAQLPEDVLLAVVGDEDPHDPAYAKAAHDEVQRLRLTDRIFFTGPLYGADKWAAYDDADVYVLPSRHENFGVTVIEALARGTPVVFCPGVQAGELAVQAGAGIEAGASVPGIRGAVEHFLAMDRDARTAASERGREFAQRELGWERTAARLAGEYRALLPRPIEQQRRREPAQR